MFGLYLHFPFCVKKCHYCDFYSVKDTGLIKKFVDAACREIDIRCSSLSYKPKADTVFFGGGTPSLMTAAMLDTIAAKLHDYFDISPQAEWTMECNPGTITEKKLRDYKLLGVNRLSIGIQSFVEKELEFLERIHSPGQAETAVKNARSAGFDNVSIDLMFAVPGQTQESWLYTINKALGLGTDHISSYSLIFEPGTPLYVDLVRGKVARAAEDTDATMYETAIDQYTKAGFEQYEVSNFARNGKKSRHNLKYWLGYEYYSFGPSAHGYTGNNRYWNYRNLHKYFSLLDKGTLPVEGSETLSTKDKMAERAFLETRAEGIDVNRFHNDFGIDLLFRLEKYISIWKSNGLMTISGGKMKLTSKGYLVCDEIALKIAEKIDGYLPPARPETNSRFDRASG